MSSFCFRLQLADRNLTLAKGVFFVYSPLKLFGTTRLASGFRATKKSTHFASCVDCDHPEDRFARNKTNPTKEHFLRFDFVVQSIETTGGQRQSTSKLLSQFHNENLIGINSFEDLHIFFTRFVVYVTAVRYDSYSHDTNDQSSGQSNNLTLS